MKLNIKRFWKDEIKVIIGDINNSLKRMEIDSVLIRLKDLFKIIQSNIESKTRVSLCFTLKEIAHFDPFYDVIIDFFMKLLEDEQDDHVKEFAVYTLGNLVLEKPNLSSISQSLPMFIKFCEDSSEHVRSSAEDIKNRLNHVKETKIKEKKVIDSLLNVLRSVIDERIKSMTERSEVLISESLGLNYEEAFKKQEIVVIKIHEFSELNQQGENEINSVIKKQVDENPIFKGEFQEEFSRWKDVRADKEEAIRQIHCVIRIQSKIYKILQFMELKFGKKVSLEELKKQTEGGLRGEWSSEEIIETLKKLVDEEILPNLVFTQIKDLKNYFDLKKKPNRMIK